MKELKLIVEKNEDGYWGRLQNYPGVYCHGSNIGELIRDCKQAIELYREEVSGKYDYKNIVIQVDMTSFFELYSFINISKLAEHIGMNQSLLRQYAKGLKFPSRSQAQKIKNGINELGQQLSHINIEP